MNTLRSIIFLSLYGLLLIGFLSSGLQDAHQELSSLPCENCIHAVSLQMDSHCPSQQSPGSLTQQSVRYIPSNTHLKEMEQQVYQLQLREQISNAIQTQHPGARLIRIQEKGDMLLLMVHLREEDPADVIPSLSSIDSLPYTLRNWEVYSGKSILSNLTRRLHQFIYDETTLILEYKPIEPDNCKEATSYEEGILNALMTAQENHWKQYGNFRSCSGNSCQRLIPQLTVKKSDVITTEVRNDTVTVYLESPQFGTIRKRFSLDI